MWSPSVSIVGLQGLSALRPHITYPFLEILEGREAIPLLNSSHGEITVVLSSQLKDVSGSWLIDGIKLLRRHLTWGAVTPTIVGIDHKVTEPTLLREVAPRKVLLTWREGLETKSTFRGGVYQYPARVEVGRGALQSGGGSLFFEEQTLPSVSIIVPSYRRHRRLDALLRTLFTRTAFPFYEVVVVENSPKEDKAKILQVCEKWKGSRLRVIEAGSKLGFSRAVNVGVKEADGYLVCLVNNDCAIPKGSTHWLTSLVVFALSKETIGTVTPVTLHADGSVYCSGTVNDRGEHYRDRITQPRRVGWNNMAVCLTHAHMFDEVGMFREDGTYQQRGSDREWCKRLTSIRGLEHWVIPVEVLHYEDNDARDLDRTERGG